ncbi:hypothetical protein [Laspinema olomoucense]|uniref:Mom family adenine methylcarbamoylation protein n=1 Tax=Laspinema olomoucense TaxID=3231600 RepID=UPI0021BADC8A|nr:hypothetical protein [Laspinema sp. D3d]MCT7971276.1 hypothetical protein [Laspinema sp. D3d]
MGLKKNLQVKRCNLQWAQELVTLNHYLHRPVDKRALPFAYSIELNEKPVGCIIMAIPHWNRQRGLFTTQSQWLNGDRNQLTTWQVLLISRLWINPELQQPQSNGHANCIASCAIAKMLKQVQVDWIKHHPPVKCPMFPYHIRLILSHADTGAGHEGTIYKAAGFEQWGVTQNQRSRHGGKQEKSGTKLIFIKRLPEPNYSWTDIVKPPQQLSLALAI